MLLVVFKAVIQRNPGGKDISSSVYRKDIFCRKKYVASSRGGMPQNFFEAVLQNFFRVSSELLQNVCRWWYQYPHCTCCPIVTLSADTVPIGQHLHSVNRPVLNPDPSTSHLGANGEVLPRELPRTAIVVAAERHAFPAF